MNKPPWSVLVVSFLMVCAGLAQAVNKPIAGYVFLEDGITIGEHSRVTVHVQVGIKHPENCSTSPVIYASGDGYYITDLGNLLTDADGVRCGDRWEKNNSIWVTCDGSTTIPYPQHNGTTNPQAIPDTSGALLSMEHCLLAYPPPVITAVAPPSYTLFTQNPGIFSVTTNENTTCRWNFGPSSFEQKEIVMKGTGKNHTSSVVFPAEGHYTLYIICRNIKKKDSAETPVTYQFVLPSPPPSSPGGGGGGGLPGLLPEESGYSEMPGSQLAPQKKTSDESSSPASAGCIPFWDCTSWGPCAADNLQHRLCSDLNNCSDSTTMPDEKRSCSYQILCFNYRKDDAETDVDCGGVCSPCIDSKHCLLDFDCVSGYCNPAQACSTPSCFDGFKNQDEEDVDCGGVCKSCGSETSVTQEQPGLMFTFFFMPLVFIGLVLIVILIPVILVRRLKGR
ncbi:hypothetical protein COY95_04720 [Candidatus Woesearchaeota archaeon CG_4_10_14_0_8_um_filter_47_5]|nr:MAG: hypothetical protein COY95_04720 [Candidatus Woesearchaeota archaeon CG_4_10_14_0_8_um_filter_47_5]